MMKLNRRSLLAGAATIGALVGGDAMSRVRSAMIMAEGTMITAEDLGLKEATTSELLFNLKEVRTRAERQAIQQALTITDGNISRTAELLGVSRPTLYDLMEKYGMRVPQ